MTKQDYIETIKDDMDELLSRQDDPFFRGQYIALDYARDLATRIHPYGTRKTARSVSISLTAEQAKYLSSLLGDGALDRLIRGKITRGMNELWK
jgi:hypothetical protein